MTWHRDLPDRPHELQRRNRGSKMAALEDVHRELGIPPGYAVQRDLPPQLEAAEVDLVEIGANPDGRPVRLIRPAAVAWTHLHRTAARDGVTLVAISGFRSVARQTEIIREKLAAGERIEEILRWVAAPGYSEHHTGRALDIGSPGELDLDECFAHTAAFRWLARGAHEFGFHLSFPPDNPHCIGYEPWHWCWRSGVASAQG